MVQWESKFELKKNRWVYVPTKEMRLYGVRIHNFLRSKWTPPLYFYHLRNGGHVACAKKHLNNQFFALIDIKNFFESTGQSRLTRALKSHLAYHDARQVAKLSTVRNPLPEGPAYIIPYGYPQSPILSTLCLHSSYCGGLFKQLNATADLRISIYMDDIILSSNEKSSCESAYDLLCKGLEKSGYQINSTKSQPPSEKIHVFNLKLENQSLKVLPYRIVDFLIAYTNSKNPHVRKGIASYVGSVNAEQARLFK